MNATAQRPVAREDCRQFTEFVFDYNDTERLTVRFEERYHANGGGFLVYAVEGERRDYKGLLEYPKQPTYRRARRIAEDYVSNIKPLCP